MPFCVLTRLVFKKYYEKNCQQPDENRLTARLFPQESDRGIFLHFYGQDSFLKQVQSHLWLCSDFLLLHTQNNRPVAQISVLFLFHRVQNPVKQADLQSSTCYQSFNILWIKFQSLVVLIHGFHMVPILKIINSCLHTGEKDLENIMYS